MSEYVILVDEHDRQIGVEEKLTAHREGKLHRAFSIFLFNRRGELLMQQRAEHKYHSGGLWANTCCGHPRPDEPIAEAAARRLQEEMAITCDLQRAFRFTYRARLEGGLMEHEIDHVFVGYYGGLASPNPKEVMAHAWRPLHELRDEIQRQPHLFVPWLVPAVEALQEHGLPRKFC